jgi:hypothetical protein
MRIFVCILSQKGSRSSEISGRGPFPILTNQSPIQNQIRRSFHSSPSLINWLEHKGGAIIVKTNKKLVVALITIILSFAFGQGR